MHKFVFAIVICSVIATLFLAGCTQQSTNNSFVGAIFKQWLDNAKTITSARVYVDGYLEFVNTNNTQTTFDFNGTIYYKNDKFRNSLDVIQNAGQANSINLHSDSYSVAGEVTTCQKIANKSKCMPLRNYKIPTNQQELIIYESIYNKGAFSFSSGETKTVVGKTCTKISITVDIPKLSTNEKEYLALMSNLPSYASASLSSFKLNICVVPEEGTNYESEIFAELIDGTKVHSYVVQTDTQKKIDIPDEIFIPPSIEQ